MTCEGRKPTVPADQGSASLTWGRSVSIARGVESASHCSCTFRLFQPTNKRIIEDSVAKAFGVVFVAIISLSKDHLTDKRESFKVDGKVVLLSPLPSDQVATPSPWLDLHVAAGGPSDWYEICGDRKRRSFREDKHGKYVPISAGHAVRLFTHEKIAVPVCYTGLAANTYSLAARGLVVTPGKVDPGFGPMELSIVVANHSNHGLKLRSGDKVICIGFAEVEGVCLPTPGPGWAKAPVDDDSTLGDRIVARLHTIDIGTVLAAVVGSVLGALAIWSLQHL